MKHKLLYLTTILFLSLFSSAIAQRPFFDKNKDILIAQFDSKPDPDDIHAQAALGSMLAHSDLQGVNAYGVAGAIGRQNGNFIDSDELFNLIFGSSNWTDADADRNGSVTRITNKVIPILQNGGKVWVQEAGQSNITRDWVIEVLKTVSSAVVKSNVIVVQHSEWNQNLADNTSNTPAANPVVLNFIRDNTNYFYLDDGNGGFDAAWTDHGPYSTPGYTSRDSKWITQAKNSPNIKARQLWNEADRVVRRQYPNGVPYDWSSLSSNGVDYSDCVENWWIFNIGSNADTVAKFWSRYVTNTDGSTTGDGCTSSTISATTGFTNTTIVGFSPAYVDNNRNALAIDASQYKDKFAAAETTFSGTSGTYNIKLNTLTEIDGESSYKVSINGTEIGTYTNPTTTTDYTAAGTTFMGISVPNGATIRVAFNSHTNGQVPEGNGTAFSRGRWTSIEFNCPDNGGMGSTGEDCSAAPTGLAVTNPTETSVVLNLNNTPTNTRRFEVRSYIAGTFAGNINEGTVSFASGAAGSTSITVQGLSAGTTYDFVVRALCGPGTTPSPLVIASGKTTGQAAPSSDCNGNFEEKNGLVVIEAENLANVNATPWTIKTAVAGYTGNGYLSWDGADSFNTPGKGVINAKIKINQTGEYRFVWRSKVGKGTNSTEHNDSWVKFLDASDFFARKGSAVIYPKGSGKTPNPAGAGADGWFKAYLSNSVEWTWVTSTSDNDAHQIFVRFDTPGEYTLQISGRSKDHLIDRIVLHRQGAGGNPTALANQETKCSETLSIRDRFKNPFKLYPNPGQNFVTIQGIKTQNVEIYDTLGKRIKSSFTVEEGEKIDISYLPGGMYFFLFEGQKQALKFVKIQ